MSNLKHDPQEDDPRLKKVIEAAEKEAEENLADLPKGRGFCHKLWAEKKRILKEKYGIQWKSPSDMNPFILFD